MKGLWLLSLAYLRHHLVQSAILVVSLAVAMLLPAATSWLVARYESDLLARADATPFVVGPSGSRFDLTLSALYFRSGDMSPLPWSDAEDLMERDPGLVIPFHQRFTARGQPVVGVSADYFAFRSLRPAAGTLPLMLGDCVLGADAADALELAPGDPLFSDQRELYDIATPSAVRLLVTGVLARAGTPDDAAVFVDTTTAWMLEGLFHAHEDASEVDRSLVLGEAEGVVLVSQALIEDNAVSDDNTADFHGHGDPASWPLTAVLVVPRDDKTGTLLRSRIDAGGRLQMVRPRGVIDDLLAVVFRVKQLLDAVSSVLAVSTVLLVLLVVALTLRLRRAEMASLHRMGCSRSAVARLLMLEVLLVLGAAAVLAGGGLLLVMRLAPDLVSVF